MLETGWPGLARARATVKLLGRPSALSACQQDLVKKKDPERGYGLVSRPAVRNQQAEHHACPGSLTHPRLNAVSGADIHCSLGAKSYARPFGASAIWRSGADLRLLSKRSAAATVSFISASKLSGGLPSSSIPLKTA